MQTKSNFAKEMILEFLDYIRFKIENDRLTMDEADSIAKTIQGGVRLSGTLDDLSAFYNQPKTRIKSVIYRRMIAKPERRVYYSFNAFQPLIPPKWKDKLK